MYTTPLNICCRPLVDAFRRSPGACGDAALVVGFDEGGAPFYRLTRLHGGQTLSAPAEPLVFCPFCGSRVIGTGEPRATRPAAEAFDEEATLLTPPEETMEIETVLALRASVSGARVEPLSMSPKMSGRRLYFSDFTFTGLAKSESETGRLNWISS